MQKKATKFSIEEKPGSNKGCSKTGEEEIQYSCPRRRKCKISNFDAEPDMESMHLNSSKGKHITASFDQNVGEAFDNQDNLSKIDDHTVTNVQSSSKTSKAGGHVPEMLMKLVESGSKSEVFEVEVQPLDEGNKRFQFEAKTLMMNLISKPDQKHHCTCWTMTSYSVRKT
ncbi:Uncharacterized protein Fot_15677 [Forsythia ovata]|uniref:Uncharacterized protein n=1 Tax=Forsythia ovata TaxID=205694 RepID=A0ABD1W9V8_9LAMI